MTQKICQSCGMPLNNKTKGTTNENKPSDDYCKFCYQNGIFTDEGISMGKKIQKNIKIAINLGMSKNEAENLANSTIPNLKRWKK
jgi:hypothetical protein